MSKPVFGFPTRYMYDTKQAQKTARGLKFRIEEVEGFHYLCCKGTG